MHREDKSIHINTRSWKCWLENGKMLGGNKSQILLWAGIFSQRKLNMIWRNTRCPGWESGCQRVKTRFSAPKKPWKGMKMQMYCPAMKAISQASILYEFELASLLSSLNKKSARWIIMNIPHLPAQEAAKITLHLFGTALRGHQPKTVRLAGIQTRRDKTTLHGDTVPREPLSWACFLNPVIWERKWKNYLEAIPQ